MVNRILTVGDDFTLDPKVKAGDANLPERLSAAALSATIAERTANFARSTTPAWASKERPYQPTSDAFNLRPDNLAKWRAARARAAAGLGQAHITCFLDSITYGAGATGVSQPKPLNSWPGRLRRMMNTRYGAAGSGIVVPWDTLSSTPADDPRLIKTGTVPTFTLGAHQLGALRWLDGAGANYVTFTDTCDEFWVYTLAVGSRLRVSVDGGAEKFIAGDKSLDPSLTDYDPEPGYFTSGSLGQVVTRVPAGALGSHSIKIMAPSNGTIHAVLVGVEARIAGEGVRVTGMSRSGIAMQQFVADDATHNMGMSVSLDMADADLAVMLLGMNDYQGHVPVGTFKAQVKTTVQRQKSSAQYAANGDVLLVTCPQPNYASIPTDGIQVPPLRDYLTALYEVAAEEDVPLLDVASRWKDFGTSNPLGYFADPLHPGNLGSEDIATAVFNILHAV